MVVARVAVGLSIVAAAAAGYAAWTACGLSQDLRTQQEQSALLAQRLSDAESALAAERTASAAKPPSRVPAPDATAGLAGRSAAGTASVPVDVEARLAALEKTEAQFRRLLGPDGAASKDDDAAGALARALPQIGDAPVHFEMPTVYGSPEDAAKHLELSPSQKSEFERAAADSKREMDELKKIPDDTGKTWNDVSKETFTMGDGGVFSFDTSKLRDFREKTVPGRNESYGAAEKRIREGAKSRLRSALTPDQQAKFDKAMVDPMLGTSGSDGASMIFSSVEIAPLAPSPSGK
jgi:hypothetical protein